ncbi:MAG TPA: hypothetical protein VHX39_35640 [Acetobacteraceae bacterium]|nr:hypothetical protein [Acetobacteraceae bacterium]
MNHIAANRSDPRVLLVSASDQRFFNLLRGMLQTLQPESGSAQYDVACFDIGMTESQREWLRAFPARIARPEAHFGIEAQRHNPALLSFLARPFLRDYFPGYDIYVWVDSDLWFQDPTVLDRYIAGASALGFAITHESEHAYRFQPRLFGWTAKHFLLGYGVLMGSWLLSRRHLNAGFFAAHADAPHWDAWANRYEAAINRTGSLVPHDQFALVQALHTVAPEGSALPVTWLEPSCNWIVDRGPPMWNDTLGMFCKPYSPYEPIGVLHLAGPGKSSVYDVRRTSGGLFQTRILPGATPAQPALLPVEVSPATDDVAAIA